MRLTTVLARWRDWFLMKFPGNRAFVEGYEDAAAGRLPRSNDPYYLDGHRIGTADRAMW